MVVGAGSCGPGWGIGKAAAVLYAREGARVFCVDIESKAAEETRDIIIKESNMAASYAADVSQGDQVEAMANACLAAFDRIDILHNNVGIVEHGGVVEATEESWDHVLAVNLKSIFLTCKHVLPHMEKAGKGAIINISSIYGMVGPTYSQYEGMGPPLDDMPPDYWFHNAGIINLTRFFAARLGQYNIRANAISPGGLGSEMTIEPFLSRYRQNTFLGRMAGPDDIKGAVVFLASDASAYVTGINLPVDAGFTAH